MLINRPTYRTYGHCIQYVDGQHTQWEAPPGDLDMEISWSRLTTTDDARKLRNISRDRVRSVVVVCWLFSRWDEVVLRVCLGPTLPCTDVLNAGLYSIQSKVKNHKKDSPTTVWITAPLSRALDYEELF